MSKELVIEVADAKGFADAQKIQSAASTIRGVASVEIRLDIGSSKAILKVLYDEKTVRPGLIVNGLKRANLRLLKPGEKRMRIRADPSVVGCAC